MGGTGGQCDGGRRVTIGRDRTKRWDNFHAEWITPRPDPYRSYDDRNDGYVVLLSGKGRGNAGQIKHLCATRRVSSRPIPAHITRALEAPCVQ